MSKSEADQALLERITDETNAHLRVVLENEISDWQKLRLLKEAISAKKDSFLTILDILYAEFSSQHETAEAASDDPAVHKAEISAEADTTADKRDDKAKLISFLEALKSINELWFDPAGVLGCDEGKLQMAERVDAAEANAVEANAVALPYIDSSAALRDAVNAVIKNACATLKKSGDVAAMEADMAARIEQERTMSACPDWREGYSVVHTTTTANCAMALVPQSLFSRPVNRTPVIASPGQIVWNKVADCWEPYDNRGPRDTTVNRLLEYWSDPSAHLRSIRLYARLDGTVRIALKPVQKTANYRVLPYEVSQEALIKALTREGFTAESPLVDFFPGKGGTYFGTFSLNGSPKAISEQLDSVFAVIAATDGAPLPVSIREEIKTSVPLVTPQPESATAENDSDTKHQGGPEAPGLM